MPDKNESAAKTQHRTKQFGHAGLAALLIGGFFVCCPNLPSQAAGPDSIATSTFVTETAPVTQVSVTVNKSRTFRVARPFTRAVVGAVELADVLPLSDRSIYIQGKKVGTTNVSLFDADARLIGVLDLDIGLDTGTLEQKIRASTGSRSIRVSSNHGQVVLTGLAPDAVAADRAMQVAKGMAGDDVVNAMSVAPAQQVLLEVRFLEATRDAGRELGVNWAARNKGSFSAVTGLGRVTPNPTNGTVSFIDTLATGNAPFGAILANVVRSGGLNIDVLVSALEEKGLVRRLAEPNLIALSGDTARFHAGGEFPVPVAANTGPLGIPTVTIEFKPFGVKLDFTPTVLSRGVINLKIAPEVSELDFTNAVQLSGTVVPAITKRNATTTVELRDGQSFAIAGLLSSQNTANMSQLPWVGSVPVLGALFRSASYQQKETDLVIIVTPRLIGPAVPGQKLATPFDSRLPSNDLDFFLYGQPEVKKRYQDYVAGGGDLKGPYGHMIQVDGAPPVVVDKAQPVVVTTKN
jgi:pilus assembly protein CpaC